MTGSRRYGWHSLRFKLVLASVVVEALMLTVLVWNSTRITGNALQEIFQNRVEVLVPLLNVSLANPLVQRDYATLGERLKIIVNRDSLVYVEVRDELGQLAASYGTVPRTAQFDTSFEVSDHVYDQTFDITLAGRVIGRARYGLNVSVFQATLASLRNQGTLVATAEIVLTILLLATLGALLTRHLLTLARAARALQGGDYSTRVPVVGRDEVTDTAQAFNAMADAFARDLTERKQAEAALRENEGRLRLALDAAHMGTFDWDVPANHITWSRWHEELWGFQPGEFGGTYEDFSQRLHPDDLPGIDAEVARCIAARTAFAREFRVVWPDGSIHWIAARGEFTFGEDDQPLHMRGAVLEITERKRAEVLLSGEKRVLEMMAEGAPLHAILETITRNVEADSNGTLCSILLLDAEGVHLQHGAAPSLPESYNRAVHGAAIGPKAGSCGTAVYRNQPVIVTDIATDPLWDDYRALALPYGLRACWSTPIRSAGGQVLGSFALYYRAPRAPGPADLELIARVTHLSAIAIERRRVEEALKQSEQRLRDLIDGLGPQMFVGLLTLDGVVVEANRSALAAAGLKPEDVQGKPVEETYWWSYSKEVQQQLREAVVRAARGEASRYDVQIRVADSQFIILDFSIQPLRDESGKIVFLVPSANVITERKRVEEALRESSRQLQTLSKRVLEAQEDERRRLARELHDELGQALTAIKINLQARGRLKDRAPELDAENLRIVEETLQQVRRLALALRPSMLDDLGLESALRWTADQQAERSGFTVQFSADLTETRFAPEIETACFRIAQEAFTNIARHAQAKHVAIELRHEGDALVMIVQDDGHGFDTSEARERAKAGGSIGVLGMQERAALVGGQFEIESSPEQGTTVRARFPWHAREETT